MNTTAAPSSPIPTSTDVYQSHNTDPFSDPIYSIDDYVSAINFSGYTLIKNALSEKQVRELRKISKQINQDYGQAYSSGLNPSDAGVNTKAGIADVFKVNTSRCAYLWGKPILDLLDHELIHAIAERTVPNYKLNDVVTNCSFPDESKTRWTWHRDYPHYMVDNETQHSFMWFFFMLDDFTTQNGATWVVPGSHRRRSGERIFFDHRLDGSSDVYPNKVQVLGKAGDLAIVNPNTIHCVGLNQTSSVRRSINVRIAYPLGCMETDHAAVAGEDILSSASGRVANMMRVKRKPLKQKWPVQPSCSV